MKKILWAALTHLAAGVVVALVIIGCTTGQQSVAYNTLYSLEGGVTTTYSAYVAGVIKGTFPTNDVPVISHDYNTFQAALLPALDAVQFNTNALASTNLQAEGADLLALISMAEGGK